MDVKDIDEFYPLQYPQGHPFALYQQGVNFIVASTEDHALRRLGMLGPKPKPVSVDGLIRAFGRKKVRNLFKSHGKNWIIKDGHVFYKEIASNNGH